MLVSCFPGILAMWKAKRRGTCVLVHWSHLHTWTFRDASVELLKSNCPRRPFSHLSLHYGRCYADSTQTIDQQLCAPLHTLHICWYSFLRNVTHLAQGTVTWLQTNFLCFSSFQSHSSKYSIMHHLLVIRKFSYELSPLDIWKINRAAFGYN
jgi:hypothetical protein